MLLAFATFVGLGDDIQNVIFNLFWVAMATVGFDIISGEPRLVFFDIGRFTHGMVSGFAIGVYGIGEMMWTINTSELAQI